MFGAIAGLIGNWHTHKAMAEQQRQADEHYQRLARNLELMGRTFKCGPWRWRIDPKHADAHGRPLSPEIKVTWLRA